MTTYSTSWRRLGIAAFAAIGMAFCLPAAAQSDEDEGEEAEDDQMVEEIIVTATYRDTMLMDTPMSISAITDVEIEMRGVEDVQSLYLSIPGLNYGVATQTYHRVNARGIDSLAWGDTGAVSTYVDNLPIAGYDGYRAPLAPNFDLERIEVLRGPQGTLYGEGSVAGTIRYITKKPSTEGFDYSFTGKAYKMQYSGTPGHRIDGMVNLPLGERLAARVTGFSRYRAGLIDRVTGGLQVIEEDVDYIDDGGFRAQIAWYPSDSLTINALAYYIGSDVGGPGITFHCFQDHRPVTPTFTQNDRERNPQIPRYMNPEDCETGSNGAYDGKTAKWNEGGDSLYQTHLSAPNAVSGGASETWIYNLSLHWEGPFADLTATTSVYDHQIRWTGERAPRFVVDQGLDREIDRICKDIVGCAPHALHNEVGTWVWQATDRASQEIRLVSNWDRRLQWSIGVYAADTVIANTDDHYGAGNCPDHVTYKAPDIECGRWALAFDPAVSIQHQQEIIRELNKGPGRPDGISYRSRVEAAVFSEVSYRLTDSLELLAGIRYAEIESGVDIGPTGVWVSRADANSVNVYSTDKADAPKFTVKWRPTDDVMVYAMWASGFRAGSLNHRMGQRVVEFDELRQRGIPGAEDLYELAQRYLSAGGDQMDTYEIGLKADILDGRISFTGNVYLMDWTNALIFTDARFEELTDPATGAVVSKIDSIPGLLNAGAVQTAGFEFEARGQLTDSLSFQLSGEYVPKAENEVEIRPGNKPGVTTTVPGWATYPPGNRMRGTPLYGIFASLSYDFELYGYDALLRSDAVIRGPKVFRTIANKRPTPTWETFGLKLLLSRDNYQFGAYIENIFDHPAPSNIGDGGYVGWHHPRTLGVQVNYNL